VKTNVANADDGGAATGASFWEKVIPAHLRPPKASDQPELIYPRRAKMGKAFDGQDNDVEGHYENFPQFSVFKSGFSRGGEADK
jgi:hypothetical protein